MNKNLLLLSFIALPFLGNAQVLLNETFSGTTLPTTWTVQQFNANETWRHIVDEESNNGYATVDYDEDMEDQNEWLITPSLNLTNDFSTYNLLFKVGMSYYWGVSPYNNYDVLVKVSVDNGTTWTQLWTENDLGTFANWEMNSVRLNISQFIGQPNVKFAFQYVGNDGAGLSIDDVIVEGYVNAPIGPDCGSIISPLNGATGVQYSPNIPLSWNRPTTGSSATAYKLYFGTNETQLSLLGSTANQNIGITGGAATTTYYWQIVPTNDIGDAQGCAINSFTTGVSPVHPYCGILNFTTVEPITKVTFAEINNASSALLTGNTAHEIYLDKVANVTPGQTYPISLEGNTGGNYTNRFYVYIDWNQNNTFEANEKYIPTANLLNSTGLDGKKVTMNITVPTDALPGNTRLRIKKTFGAATYDDPCVIGSSYGQAEDYTVNVGTLGLNDVNKTKIEVYPNPVVDYLTISSEKNINEVTIVDLTGKQVLKTNFKTKENKVNMKSLAPGIYIVTVETAEGNETFKLIKK